MTSSRFDPGSTSVRPQKPWTFPFYSLINDPSLKILLNIIYNMSKECHAAFFLIKQYRHYLLIIFENCHFMLISLAKLIAFQAATWRREK